jgi:hypothetical protein
MELSTQFHLTGKKPENDWKKCPNSHRLRGFGATLGRLLADFLGTFGHFLGTFGQLFGNFLATFGHFLGDFWATFGHFLGTFGQLFGNFLATFGHFLGNFWALFGRLLGTFRARFGHVLAHPRYKTCDDFLFKMEHASAQPSQNSWCEVVVWLIGCRWGRGEG